MKSKAQRRKFAQLLVEGKISDEVYERWNRETGRRELPERVRPKPKRAPKKNTKSKRETSKSAKPRRAPKRAKRKSSRSK
jgi:hypothetical protein